MSKKTTPYGEWGGNVRGATDIRNTHARTSMNNLAPSPAKPTSPQANILTGVSWVGRFVIDFTKRVVGGRSWQWCGKIRGITCWLDYTESIDTRKNSLQKVRTTHGASLTSLPMQKRFIFAIPNILDSFTAHLQIHRYRLQCYTRLTETCCVCSTKSNRWTKLNVFT